MITLTGGAKEIVKRGNVSRTSTRTGSVVAAAVLALALSTGCQATSVASPAPGSTSARPSATVSPPSDPALRQTLMSERVVALPGRAGGSAVGPSTAPLGYGGGPLLQALVPVVIDWGTGPAPDLQQYVNWLLQPSLPAGTGLCTVKFGGKTVRQPCPERPSPYLSLLSEYNVGWVRGGPVSDSSAFEQVKIPNGDDTNADDQHQFQRKIVTDATLAIELAGWIAQGKVPTVPAATANDPEALYIILVDPAWDVLLTSQSTRNPLTPSEPSDCDSLTAWDGYHAWDTFVPGGAAMIVVPLCPPQEDLGSSTKPLLDFSETLSHELAEAVTDPNPGSGWTGNGGWPSGDDDPAGNDEVADYCTGDASGADFSIGGNTVSKFWSDKLGHCYGD